MDARTCIETGCAEVWLRSELIYNTSSLKLDLHPFIRFPYSRSFILPLPPRVQQTRWRFHNTSSFYDELLYYCYQI